MPSLMFIRGLRRRLQRSLRRRPEPRRSELAVSIVVVCALLGVAVLSLAWLGYQATREWRRNATMVLERREEEVATLLVTELARDMRGMQESVLTPLAAEQLILDPPYELADSISGAFARFPYPESFFAWNAGAAHTLIVNRSDRPP